MEFKNLPGAITIGRVNSSNGRSWISIQVQDEVSRCLVVEVRMEFEEFAKALTGLGYQKCELELSTDAPIGKKPEYKEEFIPFEAQHFKGDLARLEKEAAVKAFEVDGWSCMRLDDLGNRHVYENRGEQSGYKVGFVRYVDNEFSS